MLTVEVDTPTSYPGASHGPPRHFALVVGARRVSHADLIWVNATLAGAPCRLAGVCNVISDPAHRGRGYGRALMDAVSDAILASDAELGLLFCAPARARFYAAAGWEPQPGAETRVGTPARHELAPLQRVVLLRPERAAETRAALVRGPLYVPFTW